MSTNIYATITIIQTDGKFVWLIIFSRRVLNQLIRRTIFSAAFREG